MSSSNIVPERWQSFLTEIDAILTSPAELVLMGGFVVTPLYGSNRPTQNLDYCSLTPGSIEAKILPLAGLGTPLCRKFHLYLERVAVATIPDGYEERVRRIFPTVFRHLRLFALDPYDLALSKLERDSLKDQQDVIHLARVVPFDLDALRHRYEVEMRWQLGRPDREHLTFQSWIEMIQEDRRTLDTPAV
jgi:hypothetical protein